MSDHCNIIHAKGICLLSMAISAADNTIVVVINAADNTIVVVIIARGLCVKMVVVIHTAG